MHGVGRHCILHFLHYVSGSMNEAVCLCFLHGSLIVSSFSCNFHCYDLVYFTSARFAVIIQMHTFFIAFFSLVSKSKSRKLFWCILLSFPLRTCEISCRSGDGEAVRNVGRSRWKQLLPSNAEVLLVTIRI